MFEKEAKEYRRIHGITGGCDTVFKDGAEYGYKLAHEEMDYLNKHWKSKEERKANEWHYPLTLGQDGQPISDNPVAESYPIEILMYDFETGSKEVIKYDTSWAYYRKDGNSIRRNHIAWQYIAIPNKEIVLPKESE